MNIASIVENDLGNFVIGVGLGCGSFLIGFSLGFGSVVGWIGSVFGWI